MADLQGRSSEADGEAAKSKDAMAALASKVEQRDEQIAALQKDLAAASDRCEDLKAQSASALRESDGRAAALEKDLAARLEKANATVAELEATASERSQEMGELQSKLAATSNGERVTGGGLVVRSKQRIVPAPFSIFRPSYPLARIPRC